MDRFVISYSSRHFADVDWAAKADRWTATFYVNGASDIIGTAVITRVIPGVTPNPQAALAIDPGCLDRIPRVVFDEGGAVKPDLGKLFGSEPTLLLLLESVEVSDEWRGTGVGMGLAVKALRRMAMGPGSVAVCYPAPIHPEHADGETCPYESDDPEVRRPDELATEALRKAWARHGFQPLTGGVYALPLD